jgi:hypothetical protein
MKSVDVRKDVVGRGESSGPTTASPRRLAGAFLLVFLLGFTSGCYTFTPAAPAPEPGTEMVLGLNDQGRVSLGQSVGPSAQTIEGRLSAKNDSAYVIAVRSVRYFNGGTNIWSGEPLSVGTSMVQEARVRRFSAGRTALVVAAAAGGVLAFILSRSIFGSSSPDKDSNPPPPDGS